MKNSISTMTILIALLMLSCEKEVAIPPIELKKHKMDKCMGCAPKNYLDTTLRSN